MDPLTGGLISIGKSVIAEGADLLSEFIEDKDERNRIAHELATLGAKQQHAANLAQLKINEESAKHSSMFVAGARPAAIWVSVFALFNLTILYPFVIFFSQFWEKTLDLPPIDTAMMWGVLSPLLGLGAYRSVEKALGKARGSISEPPR